MQAVTDKRQGFTVLELLVALTLFSFLGFGAHMLLGSVNKNSSAVKIRAERLMQLQKTVQVIERDITQAKTSTIVISDSGDSISFIRKEGDSPLAQKWQSAIPITYRLEGGWLKRYYGEAGKPQQLSSDIQVFIVRKILPNLLDIELATGSFGKVSRLLEIPDD
jgi:general secretion pathway protein J